MPIHLQGLTSIERVTNATLAARDDIDALLWRRDVRANSLAVAQASITRGAMDSAALEGADLAGVEESPMGRVLSATLAATAQAPTFADTWTLPSGSLGLRSVTGKLQQALLDS